MLRKMDSLSITKQRWSVYPQIRVHCRVDIVVYIGNGRRVNCCTATPMAEGGCCSFLVLSSYHDSPRQRRFLARTCSRPATTRIAKNIVLFPTARSWHAKTPKTQQTQTPFQRKPKTKRRTQAKCHSDRLGSPPQGLAFLDRCVPPRPCTFLPDRALQDSSPYTSTHQTATHTASSLRSARRSPF